MFTIVRNQCTMFGRRPVWAQFNVLTGVSSETSHNFGELVLTDSLIRQAKNLYHQGIQGHLQFFNLTYCQAHIVNKGACLGKKREQVKWCTLLKAEGATVSVRRKQRGLSALKQSDDCYCTIIKCSEVRLKREDNAWGPVLTQQIEED